MSKRWDIFTIRHVQKIGELCGFFYLFKKNDGQKRKKEKEEEEDQNSNISQRQNAYSSYIPTFCVYICALSVDVAAVFFTHTQKRIFFLLQDTNFLFLPCVCVCVLLDWFF
jgi:hypothetical protein